MRVFLVLLLVFAGAGCRGGGEMSLVEAPGARAVAIARAGDALSVLRALERAGLIDGVPLQPAAAALAAEAPVVVSLLPDDVVVVAARVNVGGTGAWPMNGSRVVLGKTSAATWEGNEVLFRLDGSRLLAAFGVAGPQQAVMASVLEVMAATRDAPRVQTPSAGVVAVRLAAGALPFELGPVDAALRVDGGALVVDATAASPPAEAVAALASDAFPPACALAREAALALHLPPLPGVADDMFRGRAFVGVYPSDSGAGFLVAGAPADETAWDALLADGLGARSAKDMELPGGFRVREYQGKRRLRVVRAPGIVAIAADQGPPGVPLERLGEAQAACRPSLLVRADSSALSRALLPAVLSPQALLQMSFEGQGAELAAVQALRGISAVEADAWVDGAVVRLRTRLELRPVPQ